MTEQTTLPSYDDFNENAGSDFIIPAKSPDIEKKDCKIIKLEERTNASGKKYPVMTLEDKDGVKFDVPAWARDVAPLIKQWGKNPAEWLQKEIIFSVKDKRMIIVPNEKTVEEEVK